MTDEPLPVREYEEPLIVIEAPTEPAKLNNCINKTIESSITLISFVFIFLLIQVNWVATRTLVMLIAC